MNLKKFISGVSALAIAASAFAGLAVTASADSNVTLSDDLTVAGYKAETFYNLKTDGGTLITSTGEARYRSGFGLHNFGSGNRTGDASITVHSGDILVVQAYQASSYAVTLAVPGATENTTLSASTGYYVYDITSDATSVSFTVSRGNGVCAALVMNKDTTAQTASYTVKYVDSESNEVKASTVGTGVVGGVASVDTSDIVANGQKYIYVSNDSASNTIAADGSTVVTVTYRAAAQYSYTVSANVGNVAIASGTAFEGDQVKVAYPRYVNVDGTLYEKGVTNKEYNYTFTPNEDNTSVTLEYTATQISDVVFLSEGEDIAGLTASSANNTKIRSSKSGSAYAAADTVITSLPAGKYQVYGVLFSASSGGANLSFSLGDNDFSFVSTDNTNWKDVSSDELTITETSDLVFKAGGGNAAALDFIYVVKTGDYVAPTPNLGATITDQGIENGTETFANDSATWFIITVANTGDAQGSYNTVSITDDTDTFNADVATATLAAGASIVYGGVVQNAYTFTGASVN